MPPDTGHGLLLSLLVSRGLWAVSAAAVRQKDMDD